MVSFEPCHPSEHGTPPNAADELRFPSSLRGHSIGTDAPRPAREYLESALADEKSAAVRIEGARTTLYEGRSLLRRLESIEPVEVLSLPDVVEVTIPRRLFVAPYPRHRLTTVVVTRSHELGVREAALVPKSNPDRNVVLCRTSDPALAGLLVKSDLVLWSESLPAPQIERLTRDPFRLTYQIGTEPAHAPMALNMAHTELDALRTFGGHRPPASWHQLPVADKLVSVADFLLREGRRDPALAYEMLHRVDTAVLPLLRAANLEVAFMFERAAEWLTLPLSYHHHSDELFTARSRGITLSPSASALFAGAMAMHLRVKGYDDPDLVLMPTILSGFVPDLEDAIRFGDMRTAKRYLDVALPILPFIAGLDDEHLAGLLPMPALRQHRISRRALSAAGQTREEFGEELRAWSDRLIDATCAVFGGETSQLAKTVPYLWLASDTREQFFAQLWKLSRINEDIHRGTEKFRIHDLLSGRIPGELAGWSLLQDDSLRIAAMTTYYALAEAVSSRSALRRPT